jgi:hypothetical protein
MIIPDDVCICDHCGSDHGEFDNSGNHLTCAELSALRAQVEALEAVNKQLFTAANMAMGYLLNHDGKIPAGLVKLDNYFAHQISEELFERLDGCDHEPENSQILGQNPNATASARLENETR